MEFRTSAWILQYLIVVIFVITFHTNIVIRLKSSPSFTNKYQNITDLLGIIERLQELIEAGERYVDLRIFSWNQPPIKYRKDRIGRRIPWAHQPEQPFNLKAQKKTNNINNKKTTHSISSSDLYSFKETSPRPLAINAIMFLFMHLIHDASQDRTPVLKYTPLKNAS